uniref:Uncharacterized protein n=1 Tax=Microcebus murinus TaxID=30608 RepID=A0A8C5YFW6_MICMU
GSSGGGKIKLFPAVLLISRWGLTLVQADLEHLISSDPPASAFHSARITGVRITGVSHRGQPKSFDLNDTGDCSHFPYLVTCAQIYIAM